MKRHLLIMLLLLAVALPSAGQCNIWLNDVPAVADANTHRLYFTLKKSQPYQLDGTLRWEQHEAVALNGSALQSGDDNFHITDWHDQGANRMTVDGEEWELVFTNLPLVLIDITQSALFETWKHDNDKKTPTTVTVIDANARTFENVHIENPDGGDDIVVPGSPIITFTSTAGVRVRGATSAGKEKKPFAVELTDEEGNERNVHLLGYRNDGDWILDAMFNDRLRMRNRLITDLWNSVQDLPYEKDNDYQRNGTDGEFVEVFMKGRYWGLYCFTDKIDRKKLNLKKTKDEGLETEQTRGLLWKSLFRCTATTFSSYTENPLPGKLTWEETDKDVTWEQKYPDDRAEQGNFLPIAEMIDCVGAAAPLQLLQDSLEAKFYLDNLIDYHIFTQAMQLQDNLQKNMYLSVRNINKGHQLLLTPWDLDASLGRDAGGDEIISSSKWKAFGEQLGGINNLFWRLANEPCAEYQKKFYDRWNELKAGTLSVESIRERIMAYADLFVNSGAYAREYELWNRKMEADLYDEVEFVCNFLTDNYTYFDKAVKNWGNGTTPDNPDDPTIPSDAGQFNITDNPLPYGKGYALQIVTLQGDTIYCMFTDQPEISFPEGSLQLTTAQGEESWTFGSIDYWTFRFIDNPDPADVRLVAIDPEGNRQTRFYTLDGIEVRPAQMRKGIYLMKVGGTTVKFTKR